MNGTQIRFGKSGPGVGMPALKQWLSQYQPRWNNRHFWQVQALVILIAITHTSIEVFYALRAGPGGVSELSFPPSALFFIPAVYAALNFGTVGSIATASWCIVLSVPNLIFLHQGWDRAGVMMQLATIAATAFFVGQRTDREVLARWRAEAAAKALESSELKYRGLFESSPAPILIVDTNVHTNGTVLEANPAAGALFHQPTAVLQGKALAQLIGPANAARLIDYPWGKAEPLHAFILKGEKASELFLQPMVTQLSGEEGRRAIQVLLKDVTEEKHRQAGLRAYAAHVLRAQEAERKRIAQELHDQTVQELVLLCRYLDNIESADALPAHLVDPLREARRSAEKAVGELRDFARSLRPPTLDDLGLVTALRGLIADLAERQRIEGRLDVTGQEGRMETEIELAVFRIAQEALRNVERHARAKHVVVAIAFSRQEARLDVLDDGAGFRLPPSTDFTSSGYLGLLGMRERAEAIGGRLEICSIPGQGTRVSVAVGHY